MAASTAVRALQAGKAVPAFVAVRLHLGTDLEVHMPNERAKQQPAEAAQLPIEAAAEAVPAAAPARRPWGFDGLWGQRLAERLGEHFMPALEAVQEDQKLNKRRATAAPAQMAVPSVPHVLPMTRWAMHQDSFKSTLIADEPSKRKPARLSWYHPDDTMVPRGWWSGGLLADLRYYSPFGLGGKAEAVQPVPPTSKKA